MLKIRWVVALLSVTFVGLFVVIYIDAELNEGVDREPSLSVTASRENIGGIEDNVVIDKSNAVPQVKAISQEAISLLVAKADSKEEGLKEFIVRKPNSLRDVPPPSRLAIDETGMLVVDMRVRNLFEHYLSAVGEEPLDNIIVRIKYELTDQLAGPALEEGLRVMVGYLQYRNHLGVLKNDFAASRMGMGYDLDAVENMQKAARSARYSFLDAEAIEGMFAKDDQYDDYMMARAKVMADPLLSPEEKRYQIAEVLNQAPNWIAESFEPSERLASLRTDQKILGESGADKSDLYALRHSRLGEEAAQRMQTLDERRERWRSKVSAYRVELASLLAGSHIGALDHDALLLLRAQFFEGSELHRIAAIDKLELASN